MSIFAFIENQILSMQWLSELIAKGLLAININPSSKIGGSVHFFLYDTIKITILLCVLIYLISYIQSYFPAHKSRRILGRFKGIWANLIAALLGTVTPFCSCSSIPLFIGFTKAGLPLGVTFSFLISSPMVDLGSLVLLMSIFGTKVAVAYVIFGLIIALIGGFIIDKLNMTSHIKNLGADGPVVELEEVSISIKDRLDFAKGQMIFTFKKVFIYILIGVLIGSVIHNWIPQNYIQNILGDENPFGVILATIVGAPMYADIFGTIPVAEALLDKGALLGTTLAFMMAVTTLSLPSIIMLKNVIDNKLLSLFVFICVIGIIIVGYIFNFLHNYLIL